MKNLHNRAMASAATASDLPIGGLTTTQTPGIKRGK